jgi:4-hydroxybenzoate polyprenyltransferase
MVSDDDFQSSPGALRSYAQLLRLPNLPTAMADVAMGFLLVGPQGLPGAWTVAGDLTQAGRWMLGFLLVAAALLYAAGVVLNDLMDVERDRQERPDRPLPSGRVSLRAARWLGSEMLLAGAALACAIAWSLRQPRPAIVAVALALLILLYNRVLKHTPLRSLAMGGCRSLNVLLGMSIMAGPPAAGPWHWPLGGEHWLVAAAIGLYVAGITWFAKEEVLRSDRRRLVAATLVMMAGVALLALLPQWPEAVITAIQLDATGWYALVGLLGAIILMRCLWAVAEPSPGRVRVAVAQAILSLIFLDAALTYAARGPYWACAVLMLLVPAVVLRFWIEMA